MSKESAAEVEAEEAEAPKRSHFLLRPIGRRHRQMPFSEKKEEMKVNCVNGNYKFFCNFLSKCLLSLKTLFLKTN